MDRSVGVVGSNTAATVLVEAVWVLMFLSLWKLSRKILEVYRPSLAGEAMTIFL